jgi:hypothetical protein
LRRNLNIMLRLPWLCAILLVVGCSQDKVGENHGLDASGGQGGGGAGGGGGDASDLSSGCSLVTVDSDCAGSCGVFTGGPGTPTWNCKPDPLCIGGHYRFDCIAPPKLCGSLRCSPSLACVELGSGVPPPDGSTGINYKCAAVPSSCQTQMTCGCVGGDAYCQSSVGGGTCQAGSHGPDGQADIFCGGQ